MSTRFTSFTKLLRPSLQLLLVLICLAAPWAAFAQETAEAVTTLGEGVNEIMASAAEDEVDSAVRMLVLLTSLTVIPAVLMLMTPFTRFVIIFALLRQALGLQQSPPNQVLVGLSLMLSLVVMQPTLTQVNDQALTPYLNGEMNTIEAMEVGLGPMREFMFRNMNRDDLQASMRIAKMERPHTLDDIPTPVVVTGFVLSELRSAFVIGIKVYLPFLVLDIVVASVLLGMGMMMIPPVVISLPFKLMLFVLMDGWTLLITGMVGSFV
ncbi:MAG: flagellar biosynthetic protein FliP [Kiritimatiellia bacterium]|jgi:flagellar biosynthetic protein FliP